MINTTWLQKRMLKQLYNKPQWNHPVKSGRIEKGFPLLVFIYSLHLLNLDSEATQTWLQIFATVQQLKRLTPNQKS